MVATLGRPSGQSGHQASSRRRSAVCWIGVKTGASVALSILPQSRPEPPWLMVHRVRNFEEYLFRSLDPLSGEPFGEADEIRVVSGDRMHYALTAAFPRDPAFRASSAYGANSVSHDLIRRVAVERRVKLIAAQAGDYGQRRVQHMLRFAAVPRLGQRMRQYGYGFAFHAAKLIGDPDENFPMMAGDRSRPRIGRLERFALGQTAHGFGPALRTCVRQRTTRCSTS